MATTDFSAWLDAVDLDETEQIYSLYTAVSDEESGGFFDVTTNNGRIFVKVGHVQETLMIASPEAKSVFLKILREEYMDGDSDPESWYGYQRNMDNPKA